MAAASDWISGAMRWKGASAMRAAAAGKYGGAGRERGRAYFSGVGEVEEARGLRCGGCREPGRSGSALAET